MSEGNEKTTYRCQNCGGEVRFNVKAQKFLCTACNAEYLAETAAAAVVEKDFEQQKMLVSSAELSGIKSSVCDNCGGEIFFSANETAARCPMCGSAKLRDNAGKALVKPDGLVPFKIDAAEAQERFRQFVSKRFFAPNELKKAYQEGKLEGWYIPFWTFDANANAVYTGEGGKRVTVKRDGKETFDTLWTSVRGNLSRSYDDVLVCATRSEAATLVSNVSGYDTHQVIPYSPQYLQGYLAEYRSIEAADSFVAAKVTMENDLRSMATNEIRRTFDDARNVMVRATFANITCKNILLPLYRARYNFHEKIYDYIINAQTGRVYARYPKSPVKIILTILAVAAVIAGIVLLTKALYA